MKTKKKKGRAKRKRRLNYVWDLTTTYELVSKDPGFRCILVTE